MSASDILKVSECACHSWLQVLKLQIKTVTGLSCTFSVTLSFNSSTLTRTVIKFMNISKKFETRRHLAICKGNYDFLFVYVFQIDRKCGADLSSQICVKNISNGIIWRKLRTPMHSIIISSTYFWYWIKSKWIINIRDLKKTTFQNIDFAFQNRCF